MKISEALQALKEGECLRLPSWDKGFYIHLNDKGQIIDKNGKTDVSFWAPICYEIPLSTMIIADPETYFEIYEEPYTIDDAFNDLKEIYAKYPHQEKKYDNHSYYIIDIGLIGMGPNIKIYPSRHDNNVNCLRNLFPFFNDECTCEKAIQEIGKDKILKIAKTLKGIK